MTRYKVILVAVVLAVFGLGALNLFISEAVRYLPNIQVVNVDSGCTLNGDPDTELWTVTNGIYRTVYVGNNEARAVQSLIDCAPVCLACQQP